MSDQPQPHEGGSFIRQPDGSLKRSDTAPPAAKPDKPSRTPKEK